MATIYNPEHQDCTGHPAETGPDEFTGAEILAALDVAREANRPGLDFHFERFADGSVHLADNDLEAGNDY